MASEDPHLVPLYFLLSRVWMSAVGSSPGIMRTLSALFGVLAIPAIFWLASVLFRQRQTALIAVLLLCVSPVQVLMAREARPYSLFVVLSIMASAAFMTALKRRERAPWLAYTVILTLGLYSHLLFFMVAVIHGAYVLLARFLPVGVQVPSSKTVKRYISANAAALLLFSPWILLVYPYVTRIKYLLEWVATPRTIEFLVRRWGRMVSVSFVDLDQLPLNVQLMVIIPIVLLVAYALVYLMRSGPPEARLLILLLVAVPLAALITPDLIFGGWRSTVARYMMLLFIGLQLAMAHLLSERIRQSERRQKLVWMAVFAGLLIVGAFSSIWAVQAHAWWDKGYDYGYPEMVQAIEDTERPLIIVDADGADKLGRLLSIAVEIEPHIDMLWTSEDIPAELSDYSDVFVFQPSAALRKSLEYGGARQLINMDAAGLYKVLSVDK